MRQKIRCDEEFWKFFRTKPGLRYNGKFWKKKMGLTNQANQRCPTPIRRPIPSGWPSARLHLPGPGLRPEPSNTSYKWRSRARSHGPLCVGRHSGSDLLLLLRRFRSNRAVPFLSPPCIAVAAAAKQRWGAVLPVYVLPTPATDAMLLSFNPARLFCCSTLREIDWLIVHCFFLPGILGFCPVHWATRPLFPGTRLAATFSGQFFYYFLSISRVAGWFDHERVGYSQVLGNWWPRSSHLALFLLAEVLEGCVVISPCSIASSTSIEGSAFEQWWMCASIALGILLSRTESFRDFDSSATR